MVKHLIVIVHWFYWSPTFPHLAPYRAKIVSELRVEQGACIRRHHNVRLSTLLAFRHVSERSGVGRAAAQRIDSFQEIAEVT